MPRRSEAAPWWEAACELIVRQGLTLRQAALEQKVFLSAEQAEEISRQKAFQQVLWQAKQKYYRELGHDPTWSRKTAVGQIRFLVGKLAEEGAWEKAAEALVKACRVEGWLTPEQSVNVFASLSDKELKSIKGELEAIVLKGKKAVN